MNIFLPWLGVVEFIYKIFAPKFQFPFFKNNVYLVFFVWFFHPTRELFTYTEMSSISVKGCKFLSMISAPLAIEQWGFLSAPHLLWHVTYVYKWYPWGPVTITPVAESLTVELSLPVLTTKVSRGWDSNTRPTACRANSLTDGVAVASYNV